MLITIFFTEAGVSARINKLISHPTLPVAISAHEDRSIRFFDSTSGQAIDTMVAHLDAVTSLAVDPNGLYLLSGSKYKHFRTVKYICKYNSVKN